METDIPTTKQTLPDLRYIGSPLMSLSNTFERKDTRSKRDELKMYLVNYNGGLYVVILARNIAIARKIFKRKRANSVHVNSITRLRKVA